VAQVREPILRANLGSGIFAHRHSAKRRRMFSRSEAKQIVNRRRIETRSPVIAGEGYEVGLSRLLKAFQAVWHEKTRKR
jgi:hypothetical protein